MQEKTRSLRARWLVGLIGLVGGLTGFLGWWTMGMPGARFTDAAIAPPPEIAAELQRHVVALAAEIGERNYRVPGSLDRTVAYLRQAFAVTGLPVEAQTYRVNPQEFHNLWVTVPGRGPGLVIVGAHYDSAPGSPGADDNASGVAALLLLAQRWATTGQAAARQHTVRFVAFVNEEPPFFHTEAMGSLVYARASRSRGDDIRAMISLESIGYYTTQAHSQHYPFPLRWFYPNRGDFIAWVANLRSRSLLRRSIETFRRHAALPSVGGALPGGLPGVGWSDQWAFWTVGYPAVMVTDTAGFRHPGYHQRSDTPDRLDYHRAAQVVLGVEAVITDLAGKAPS